MVSKLVCALSAILFSHRYDKKDQFAIDFEGAGRKINFDIIRDVMYKYSKKSQTELLSRPEEALLLMNFACAKEGKAFVLQKEKCTSTELEDQ